MILSWHSSCTETSFSGQVAYYIQLPFIPHRKNCCMHTLNLNLFQIILYHLYVCMYYVYMYTVYVCITGLDLWATTIKMLLAIEFPFSENCLPNSSNVWGRLQWFKSKNQNIRNWLSKFFVNSFIFTSLSSIKVGHFTFILFSRVF